MRVLIAPDKFKGTLTASEVCLAITEGIHDFDASIEVVSHPLADGGEGTLDLLEEILSLGKVELEVHDPLYRSIPSYYLKSDHTAFIEMALASGLPLLAPEERNPLRASSHGTGELIKHALEQGLTRVYLMIGGSATNDGGTGMAEALGYSFNGQSGSISGINGNTMGVVHSCSNNTGDLLNNVSVTVLTDVQNKLLGPNGATHVYGRQKGADDEMIIRLEQNMQALAGMLDNGFEDVPGAGAAGGLGYGAMSFLKAELKSGIETVMEITGFDRKLDGVDLIISGEGKMDLQTVEGKVIAGVAAKAEKAGIPFSVICGVADDLDKVQENIKALSIHPLVNEETTSEEAISQSFQLVRQRAYQLIRQFAEGHKNP